MILIRPFVNAFAVYNSYIVRPMTFNKPKTCNSLLTWANKPWLFADKDMCPDCTCKFSCRYMDGGTPEFVPYVNIEKNLVYNINEIDNKSEISNIFLVSNIRVYN